MNAAPPIVIVGAGQASVQLIGSLRAYGYAGSLTLVGDEPMLPYHRPPLSKRCLLEPTPRPELLIRTQDYYERNGVDQHLGRSVTRIDRDRRRVRLSDGEELPYSTLVIATGGRPRTLSTGATINARAIQMLRTVGDAERIRAEARPGRKVVLVGGGYVGLEVAASLVSAGCDVTIVEAQQRVLARAASTRISELMMRIHARHGARIITGETVASIEGANPLTLSLSISRQKVTAELLIVGVGMQPNSEIAEAAGVRCGNGVIVDADCRSSDAAIYAIGDVATRPDSVGLQNQRIESVDNAVQMGKQAAASISGAPPPPRTPPVFWSDQYTARLQMVGVPSERAQCITREDGTADRLSCFFIEGRRVVAAQCVNAAGDFMAAKRLIAANRPIEPAELSNPAVKLRDL